MNRLRLHILAGTLGLLLCIAAAQAQQLGEIKLFAGSFAPRGWLLCDGQILPIANYTALFSLLGTTYGGDGRTTFALPDLRGRAPVHVGQGPGLSRYTWGQKGGSENRTLTLANLPAHAHNLRAAQEKATSRIPDGHILAESWNPIYTAPGGTLADTGSSTTATGGGVAVENRQPFLGVNYIIAITGTYPSRN